MTCINVTSQDYGRPVDPKQPVLGSVIVEQLTTSNADRQRVCGWAAMDYAMMIDYG